GRRGGNSDHLDYAEPAGFPKYRATDNKTWSDTVLSVGAHRSIRYRCVFVARSRRTRDRDRPRANRTDGDATTSRERHLPDHRRAQHRCRPSAAGEWHLGSLWRREPHRPAPLCRLAASLYTPVSCG